MAGAEGVAVSTAKDPSSESAPICPYWHEVASDFVSMYPTGGYCIAGCHKRIKVMAEKTLEEVCAMNFAECEGYQRLLAEEEAKKRQEQETIWR
jgi:hypothetical protein